MKKTVGIILLLICMLINASVYADENEFVQADIQVFLNDEQLVLTQKPMLYHEVRWLPLSEICRSLQYNLAFDRSTNVVVITPEDICRTDDDKKITFTVGSECIQMVSGEYVNEITNAYTNNDSVYEPMSCEINGEIYMPAYYLCRAFGLKLKRYSNLEPNVIKMFTRGYLNATMETKKPQMIVIEPLALTVEGVKVSFQSMLFTDENGRLLVPVRELCELLNYHVYWFEDPQRVCITADPNDMSKYGYAEAESSSGGTGIWFSIGERQYRINGDYFKMDTAAQIVNQRTYVPLRVLAEFMGYDVIYVAQSGA